MPACRLCGPGGPPGVPAGTAGSLPGGVPPGSGGPVPGTELLLAPCGRPAGGGSRGDLAAFFQTCRRRFDAGGQESWAESWWAALDQTPLPLEEEDRRLLQEAGDVLGRYDGESQRQALTALVQRLADQAQKARATAQRLFRVYVALGVAGGLFCVIML